METLEVQAKDFLVKWVNAPEDSSITWQVKSLRKSVNFAIYQKNDSLLTSDENVTETSTQRPRVTVTGQSQPLEVSMSVSGSTTRLRSTSVTLVNPISRLSTFKSRSRSSTFSTNLSSSGLTLVKDYHKLLPDELVRGVYNADKGGTFAFIFDNTFSKTTSKTIFFSAKLTGGEMSMQSRKTPLKHKYNPLQDFDHSNDFATESMFPKDGELMQGVLSKKRRKKLQGFTKRFFILNFKYGTLSYFKSNDNKLRGQMPIPESIVSADAKTKQLFIDSGMEVWNLKALNAKDFEAWINAFSIVKKRSAPLSESNAGAIANQKDASFTSKLRDVEHDVKTLLLNISVKSPESFKADLQTISLNISNLLNQLVSSDASSIISDGDFYDADDNLDAQGFGVVLMTDMPQAKQSRSDEESTGDNDVVSESSLSSSDADTEELPVPTTALSQDSFALDIKDVACDLYPLPLLPIKRDCDILACDHCPPSLLSFVRKNVGKDLSSLSMPVDMNEPISILQKYTEILEYSDLIDNALQGDYPEHSGELILRIAAFSISYLAAMRVKVRSSRKPFNPLLGETYELVREDKGFRMLCEKISHRPAVFAMFAESAEWTLSFSPSPSQKFWGKTSEFYTSGNVKLTIRKTGEVFTWSQPTLVLKNIIAGEKYTEPSTSYTVKSSSGQRAVIEFAKGGMFSGRSEELTIEAFDSSKKALPYTVFGKWTESMTMKTNSTEKLIWTAGDLLPQCDKKFGFTAYAGSLNKISLIEKDKLPPTDSRFRPDMQAYEIGNVSDAEILKQKVEEGQRLRRKKYEASGNIYQPHFFKQVGGDPTKPDSGDWVYITGDSSYWERRKTQNWTGIPELW